MTTDKRILGDREKAMEESYFLQQDARLVERLRQMAKLDDIAKALAAKLEVDNPELLARVREVGVTAETATAFFMAPLIEVAWADGPVSQQERETVLRLARGRGIEQGSPADAQLIEWLSVRPSEKFFDTALEVLRAGYSVLPPDERKERIGHVMAACREVAEASGSEIAKLIGLGDGVSRAEASILDIINHKLRIRT